MVTAVMPVSDTLSPADAQAAAENRVGDTADTLTPVDSQTRSIVAIGAVSDALSPTDSQSCAAVAVGTASDTLTPIDAQAAAFIAGINLLADTLALGDSSLATVGVPPVAINPLWDTLVTPHPLQAFMLPLGVSVTAKPASANLFVAGNNSSVSICKTGPPEAVVVDKKSNHFCVT
jgi:hypothetical protein